MREVRKAEFKEKILLWFLNYALYIVLAFIVIVGAVVSPNFLTVRNI